MFEKTLHDLRLDLDQKQISSVELTQYYLDRIEKMDARFNAFISVHPEFALSQAKKADALIAKGEQGPLTGLVMAHKDIFCTKDQVTSCGSKMLSNFVSPYNATMVENLNQAGMISVGKLNMDEFAMGSSNESSFYGPCKNPWDLDYVSGGSSGGSASAVAARLVPASTGSDTGGSIRQPAAFCGITGLKPTYGAVSRYGMVAFASSLDQAGPMALTAKDCAMMLEGMAGFDPLDSTSAVQAPKQYTQDLETSIQGMTIGLPKQYFNDALEPNLAKLLEEAIEVYRQLGATIKEIDLPNARSACSVYYIIASAECSSNLSRFDGVRYGHRSEQAENLEQLYKLSRAEGFGVEVKRRIMMGTYALSAGYYDAYYLKAQKVRRLIADDFNKAFEDVDVILSPTTPHPAFKIGEKINDPISMYLSDSYTIPCNMAGLPGLNLPCGFIDGMPTGFQLIAPHFQEAKLCQFGHQYQTQTPWHQQVPPTLA